MRWSNIRTTICKELRGIFRDRKSLITLLALPFIIPFYILLMGFMFDVMEDSNYIIGANYEISNTEKAIINEVGELDFKYYADKEALDKAYENDEIDGYVIKDDKTYTIYSDMSSNTGTMIYSYVNAYLTAYNENIANNYVISQDIDPDKVFENIIIESQTLDDEDRDYMLMTLLSISITYILMIIVISTSTVATDATAGEKERGTLETLLTFPIKSSEIITGKYIAIALCGMILGIAALVLLVPSLAIGKLLFVSFEDFNTNLSAFSIMMTIFIIVISSLLSAGIAMALAGNTKTYKEAQSALQGLSFISMIPMFLELLNIDNQVFDLIPLANCGLALNRVLTGDFTTTSLLTMLVSTIIYTTAIILYISKQYKSEKTLFG
jgi:sodium transport system permease protein